MQLFAVFLASSVAAQTIADLISQDSRLAQVAAVISQNPNWSSSTARISVFAPTTGASAAGGRRAGTITINEVLNFTQRPNYRIFADTNVQIVYDNYNPDQASPNEIRIRFGTGEARVSEFRTATNGRLFIMDNAVPDDQSVTTTLASKPDLSGFLGLIRQAKLEDRVNAIRGATILAPNNAAITARGQLTDAQVEILVQQHILVGNVVYSTAIGGAPVNSLLGPAVTMQYTPNPATGEGSLTANGVAFAGLSDVFCNAGVIHVLAGTISTTGTTPGQWPGFTATSTTAAATSAAPASSSSASTTTSTRTSSPTGQANDATMLSVSCIFALVAMYLM